ncbi:hypothetical protein, partial [Streptococcus agalactiae]|uniref:hypothetical protein n=1 Tax=Streptococcus agalactiae TaxID=1311 RepID=UPI001A7EA28A
MAKVTISLLNACEGKKCSLLLKKEESETVSGDNLGNRAFEKIQEAGDNSVYENVKKSYDNPTTRANMLGE